MILDLFVLTTLAALSIGWWRYVRENGDEWHMIETVPAKSPHLSNEQVAGADQIRAAESARRDPLWQNHENKLQDLRDRADWEIQQVRLREREALPKSPGILNERRDEERVNTLRLHEEYERVFQRERDNRRRERQQPAR